MTDRFAACLPLILAHEGGFVNHPKDPGGATMKGVTQKVYDAYRDVAGGGRRSVREIGDEELSDIYRDGYWIAARCEKLPVGIDYLQFDTAVNMGVGRAAQFLQEAVGVTVDRKIGPATLAAVAKVQPATLIRSYVAQRRAFYERLPTFPTFGKGWLRRLDEVRAKAVAWAA